MKEYLISSAAVQHGENVKTKKKCKTVACWMEGTGSRAGDCATLLFMDRMRPCTCFTR